ncbi:MAG: DUF58 domain-containing protein [Deltaproteobacteria bacterium]|nr:DUF58 domain-containing protein [Deltaproteobacteria bacterium]
MKNTRLYLTDYAFAVFALLQVLGGFCLLFPHLLSLYILAHFIFVILLVVDFQKTKVWEAAQLFLSLPKTPELGEELSLKIQLRNFPSVDSFSKIEAIRPRLLRLKFSDVVKAFCIEQDEAQVSFDFVAQKLGYEKIEFLLLKHFSKLKFWVRKFALPIMPEAFRVIPTRQKISDQAFEQILPLQNLLHAGARRRMQSRAAEQFHSLREYQYPDSRRHIDARKSAKLGKLMTRTFDSLHDHHLIVVLDLGRSMLGNIGSSRKMDFYLSAALTLIEHSLAARDRVSFIAFAQKVEFAVYSSRSARDFLPLFEGNFSPSALEQESNFALLNPLLQKISGQRSILLLLTDVFRSSNQDYILKYLAPILPKHLTLSLSLIDEKYDLKQRILSANPQNFDLQSYNRLLYSYSLDESVQLFREKMAVLGAGVVTVPETYWLTSVEKVYRHLRNSGRL